MTAGLLAAVAVPLVAACDDGVDLPRLPELGPDPDEPLLAAALQAERELVATVRRTVRRHRSLRPLLSPTADVHDAHVALLAEAADGSPPPAAPGARVPAAPRAALYALMDRERTLAEAHVQRALAARSGPFARIVGVLAAAATQQSVVLAEAANDLRGGRR